MSVSMSGETLIRQFAELAEAEAATIARVAEPVRVPGAVADYLSAQGLSMRICTAPDRAMAGLDWKSAAHIEISSEPIADDGGTAVTGCYGGIAEAGALVVLSSPDHPTELNFLPETHVVVLRAEDIMADFEALWSRLREEFGPDAMPRAMNFIVGPSRTADLGVPSKLGAHGPARVHIIIIDQCAGRGGGGPPG
jgi:L-lactate dehydrogenase complex protein LldG